VLPVDYTFVAGDHGAHPFSVVLKTAGSRTITGNDVAQPSKTGAATTSVVAGPPIKMILTGASSPCPASVTNGGTFKSKVALLDGYNNATVNNTGATVTVTLSATPSGNGTLSTPSVSFDTGAAETGEFSFTISKGSPPSVTVTATAQGQSWTSVGCVVSK
jgi:hypothetical protein